MQISKDHLQLHLIVFIWGFTAILGALISINAVNLVWYRMMIAAVGIGVYAIFTSENLVLSRRKLAQLLLIGALIATHWIFFFWAIKVSNVSVTLACLSSTTLFVSLLEPLILRRRLIYYEILIGVLICIALYIIFSFEGDYFLGIILSLGAALAAALFGILNARLVRKSSPISISFYEMLGGFVFISIVLGSGIMGQDFNLDGLRSVGGQDLIYLLILGLVCTAYAFVISVKVMKRLSPFTVALSINLEPVYGIILAFLIFGESEHMSAGFYFGAVLIIFAIFLNAILKLRVKKESYGAS